MTDAELWAAWRFWLVVAGAVIVVAAALLVTILVTARGIRRHAVRALRAAELIRDRTGAIWGLQATNDTAADILATVQAIEAKGARLAEALEARAAGGARR